MTESRNIAIKISNVKKQYKLGEIGGGSLQADLQTWWAKKRGKEDPNAIIGQSKRLVGKTFMALNGIDLTIYEGEAVGIIGGNGAGKSTLLKILSRVTAPTNGRIDIYGRIASMLEVGTGFNAHMTGRENIYMNGAILGMTREEIDSKIDQITEFSEVSDFIDTPVKRYSSGMYVKLAFAVAAHLDSEIMIMDEVLAVGDMAYQQKCLKKMRDEATICGKTVLYVSHNMNTIRQLCDRVIVLDQGKVVFDGDVEEGIGIYMKVNTNNSSYIDFRNVDRTSGFAKKVKVLEASYEGKDSITFLNDEHALLKIKWNTLIDVNDIGLRVEIWTLDSIAQGTYVLYDVCSCKKDNQYEIIIDIDLSLLSESKFQTYYTFFQCDKEGNNSDIECVPGLHIDKKIIKEGGHLVWHPKNWGYIMLPTPSFEVKDVL